jgi:hypothetical protein
LEQVRINNTIVKKLASNDKILEDINTKIDDFSSAIKDQLDYNKKVETQLSWLAASFATNNEQVKGITTRHGKTTKDPPYSKGAQRKPVPVIPTVTEEKDDEVEEVQPQVQNFQDTNILPFSRRDRKLKMDAQFSKFVEIIQKLYINVPLLDAL